MADSIHQAPLPGAPSNTAPSPQETPAPAGQPMPPVPPGPGSPLRPSHTNRGPHPRASVRSGFWEEEGDRASDDLEDDDLEDDDLEDDDLEDDDLEDDDLEDDDLEDDDLEDDDLEDDDLEENHVVDNVAETQASVNDRIYKTLIDNCLPPSDGWFARQIATTTRSASAAPADLLRLLRSKFSDAQLREANVIVARSDGASDVQLHPYFCTAGIWIPLVVGNKVPTVFDIIGSDGALGCPGQAFIRAVYDRANSCALDDSDTFFITSSIEDMALLRAVGLAASTATGLDRLRRGNLGQFRKIIGEEAYAVGMVLGNFHVTVDRLVLVAGSINRYQVDEPPQLAAIANHLRQLQHVFDLNSLNVEIWRPTSEQLEQIRFAFEHGNNVTEASELIKRLTKHSLEPLITRKPIPTLSLGSDYENMICGAAGPPMGVPDSQRRVRERLRRDGYARLLDDAEKTADVNVANLKRLIAQLSHEVTENLMDRHVRRASWSPRVQSKDDYLEITQALAIANTIVSMTRGINACEKQTIPKKARRRGRSSSPFPQD
jgi:hypothetical protein